LFTSNFFKNSSDTFDVCILIVSRVNGKKFEGFFDCIVFENNISESSTSIDSDCDSVIRDCHVVIDEVVREENKRKIEEKLGQLREEDDGPKQGGRGNSGGLRCKSMALKVRNKPKKVSNVITYSYTYCGEACFIQNGD
jgi:hypothetical protein